MSGRSRSSGGRRRRCPTAARDSMRAARAVVEAVAHGAHEHTYGVNTGFGRFVSKSIPEEQTEELQLRLLRSHACGVGEPVSRPGRACRDAAAGERARERQLGRAGRDGRAAARMPEPRRAAVRARARLGRRLGRPRAARAPRAAARRRRARVVGRRAARRRRRARVAPASSRCAWLRRKACR